MTELGGPNHLKLKLGWYEQPRGHCVVLITWAMKRNLETAAAQSRGHPLPPVSVQMVHTVSKAR
jgi:hypothetical protein